jgi:hypothetical protein
MAEELTYQYLSECFHLNVETGVLTWIERPASHFTSERGHKAWRTKYLGKEAGVVSTTGYRYLMLSGRCRVAHRIVYALAHGLGWDDVPEIIDHVNGVKSDNSVANLRPANHRLNGYNSRTPARNTSGFKGVSYRPENGKWRADIASPSGKITLGSFLTKEEASAAYEKAARDLHGEFYRNTQAAA